MLIVLETGLLHGRTDPEATSEIKPLLSLAAKTGVAVKIPEPCLIELREGYRANIQDASEQVEKLRRKVVRLASLLIDKAAEFRAYEERLQKFLQGHEITTIPFPDLPDPKGLFEAAARKQSPFDANGNNFRDAVICLSVSQFARSADGEVLLVTDDRGFRVVLTGQEGFQAVNLQEAIKRLESQLSQKDRALRAKLSEQIGAELRQRLAEIATAARPQVEFSLADRIAIGLQLIRLDELVAENVQNVEPTETSGLRTAFTAEIDAKARSTVRIPPQAPMTWGALTTYLPSILGWSDAEAAINEVNDFKIIVEGEATLDAQGKVEKLEFTRVRSRPAARSNEVSLASERTAALRKLIPKLSGS